MPDQKQPINPLPAKLAKKFEPAEGVLHIFASSEFGMVDLRTITEELAERLVKAGYLKKL